MVRLRKIQKDENFIEAHYIPEDSQEEGYLKIRLRDKEVVDYKMTSFDGKIGMYLTHAINGLEQIIDEGAIPEERLIMWY